MARLGDAAAMRGLALAISLLLLGIASDDLAHAFGRVAGHGSGLGPVVSDGAGTEPGGPPPNAAPECPTCRAARSASVLLCEGTASTAAVATLSLAVLLPETPAPASLRHRADPARAPPARLVV